MYLVVKIIADAPAAQYRTQNLGDAKRVFNIYHYQLRRLRETPGLHHDVYEDSVAYISDGSRVISYWPRSIPASLVQRAAEHFGLGESPPDSSVSAVPYALAVGIGALALAAFWRPRRSAGMELGSYH